MAPSSTRTLTPTVREALSAVTSAASRNRRPAHAPSIGEDDDRRYSAARKPVRGPRCERSSSSVTGRALKATASGHLSVSLVWWANRIRPIGPVVGCILLPSDRLALFLLQAPSEVEVEALGPARSTTSVDRSRGRAWRARSVGLPASSVERTVVLRAVQSERCPKARRIARIYHRPREDTAPGAARSETRPQTAPRAARSRLLDVPVRRCTGSPGSASPRGTGRTGSRRAGALSQSRRRS